MSKIKNFVSFERISESKTEQSPRESSIHQLWQNPEKNDLKLDNLSRKKLLKIAESFFQTISPVLGDVELRDFRISGDCMNPKNPKFSDIDLDIIVNFNSSNRERVNDTKKRIYEIRSNWILENCPKCRGYFVDLHVLDSSKIGNEKSYSLKNKKYNPGEEDSDPNDAVSNRKFSNISTLIENLESKFFLKSLPESKKSLILETAYATKKRIQKMRKNMVGKKEASTEDLTFQKLKNEGYINRLVKILNFHK